MNEKETDQQNNDIELNINNNINNINNINNNISNINNINNNVNNINNNEINNYLLKYRLPLSTQDNALQLNSPLSDENLLTTGNKNKIKITESEIQEINEEKTKEKKNEINNIKIYSKYSDEKLNKIFKRLTKDETLECDILINPESFVLYSSDRKFLLCAKEEFSFTCKNYLIYSSRDFDPNSVVAKLHSYSFKNEFILYDNGEVPKSNKDENKNVRRYLMQIKFLNDKVYRHFLIFLPIDDIKNNKKFNYDKDHKDKFSLNTDKTINILESDQPKYNFQLGKFVENFSKRVKEKSKYNFKISNENKKAIECGKINDCNFALDIKYPFSPLEAFGIVLAMFAKD